MPLNIKFYKFLIFNISKNEKKSAQVYIISSFIFAAVIILHICCRNSDFPNGSRNLTNRPRRFVVPTFYPDQYRHQKQQNTPVQP